MNKTGKRSDAISRRLKRIVQSAGEVSDVLQSAGKRQANRRSDRAAAFRFALIYAGRETSKAIIRDVSNNGAKVVLENALSLPAEFDISLGPAMRPRRACVIWRDGPVVGLAFLPDQR